MKLNSSTLAFRLHAIKEEIAQACLSCGRDPNLVKLVAVSKGQPFEAILEAYELGLRDFGESYAQEFSHKLFLAADMNISDITWHFIGALQSNKIKAIAKAQVVQSIDSLRHAELLHQAADSNLEVFLQVNLSPAQGRRGFAPEELKGALKACAGLPKLHVQGLMTILPLLPQHPTSYWFKLMSEIRHDLSSTPLKLSMGMSGDFTEAIAHGADLVRIGTSLFGPREDD